VLADVGKDSEIGVLGGKGRLDGTHEWRGWVFEGDGKSHSCEEKCEGEELHG
jgi:hypothetical protein